MIELTPTASVYALWEVAGPTLLGWWSIVCLFIIAVLRGWWWMTRKRTLLIAEEPSQDTPIMSKEVRLQQLLEINTSVRTPEQKAKALLAHLFIFIGEEYDEQSMQGYTLEEIKHISGAELLISSFALLYTIVYTDQKATHARINEISKTIYSLIAGT